jgi:hypothetical protein
MLLSIPLEFALSFQRIEWLSIAMLLIVRGAVPDLHLRAPG